jgi:hypothetical protein
MHLIFICKASPRYGKQSYEDYTLGFNKDFDTMSVTSSIDCESVTEFSVTSSTIFQHRPHSHPRSFSIEEQNQYEYPSYHLYKTESEKAAIAAQDCRNTDEDNKLRPVEPKAPLDRLLLVRELRTHGALLDLRDKVIINIITNMIIDASMIYVLLLFIHSHDYDKNLQKFYSMHLFP